jgi:hypothetical protein
MMDSVAQYYGFKNKIINGAMVIDQRNAGAAVTVNAANSFYGVDRWFGYGQSADGVFTLQRITDAPSGFTNSMRATVTTADASIGASQLYLVQHRIEGFNVADFGFGTAVAVPVTLSFWVKSSVTGTFSGSLGNTVDLSYAFSYTISSANTWTQISVTVPGPTTGTWNTGNGIGLSVTFSLGVGSAQKSVANTWANYPYATTGSVDLISTPNATWQVTGVQLEKGSTATSFDYRPYGTELALCQRYYYRVSPDVNAPFGAGFNVSTTQAYTNVSFPTVMRIIPTAVEQTGTASNYRVRHSGGGTACSSVVSFVNGSPSNSFVIFTVASGLTTGQGSFGESNLAGAYLAWSAEL